MYKVMEDMRNESLREGIEQGMKQGVKEGGNLNIRFPSLFAAVTMNLRRHLF